MPSITWKFVDRPEAATATTLLDMNRVNGKMVLDMGKGFDISPPELKQSFANNSLLDGARLTASAFENRVLKFSLGFQGTLTERIAMIAAVNKELHKPKNLIMYRPHPSATPVYFRTMRSDQYSVINRGGAAEVWGMDLEVVAEPFAIGERLQPFVATTASNDAAASTNSQRLDFPTIVGDVPSPAFVHIEFPSGMRLDRFDTFYLASRTRNNVNFHSNKQFASGDLSASVGDSFMFSVANASGGQAAATNFAANNTLAARASFTCDNITDAFSLRGRYRMLMRVHSSVVPSSFAVRLKDLRFGTEEIYSKTLIWNADTTANWDHLDFGVFVHPPYEAPEEFGYSGEVPGYAVGDMAFTLHAQRLSGTGNFEFDFVTMLPADESLMMFSTHQVQSDVVLDGPNEMVYGMWSSSPFDKTDSNWYKIDQGNGLMPWRGAIPDLVPNAPNSWFFFNNRGEMADNFIFNVYYWPRWLEVATP